MIHSAKQKLAISMATILLVMSVFKISGQEAALELPKVKISGMVKTDLFFDTRQTVSAREGHFLLFPAALQNDVDGQDVNDKSSFNFLPIQSILSANITGPITLGARTSALIEGDFFGTSNNDVNMLRLRHAYVKFNWTKTELIIGQYWHPLFVTSCYPGTVSFNTGAPIQPFSRAPQIRLSYVPGKIRISGALLSQRDYVSMGPDGASSKYIRDAHLPEIQVSAELTVKEQKELIIGAGLGYKQITPQIKTGKGFKTSENVHGFSANAYLKRTGKYFTFKLEGAYLENGSEFLTLSGYAVRDTLDYEKGIVSYAPVKSISYWGEVHSNGKKFQAGIFAGYTENLGTGVDIKGPFYLMSNMPVKSLYRVSPRALLKFGTLTLALEIEYTSALYGTPADNGEIVRGASTDNTRFLLTAMYKF